MRPFLVTPRWPSASNSHRFCHLSQIRTAGYSNSSQPAAKGSFATLGPASPRTKHLPPIPNRGLFLRSSIPSVRSYRFSPPKTSKPSVPAKAQPGSRQANPSAPSTPNASPPAVASRPFLTEEDEAALLALEHAKNQLLTGNSIPGEQEVLSALDACSRFASLHSGKSVREGLERDAKQDTSAAFLLSLDGSPASRAKASPTVTATATSGTESLINSNDYISRLAFEIVTDPLVVITPRVLASYVDIQRLLGDPDPLPYVFDLYASKPTPRGSPGSLEFVKRNPNKAANAVEPMVAEKALDIAIEAKSLDAAVGIVANTYGSAAFVKQKLLRKALLPSTAFAAMPFAVYLVAAQLAKFQSLYDDRTATVMAAAGLTVYVGCTGFFGALALFTYNDQMNRVTWAPGMRLFTRWLREEERAGLDKVACAFGFSEVTRHGEEEGIDFESLKNFILLRGMVLDRVESMPGMK